ncbi:hypothetical protein LCGC14_2643960, partial [marine sediment metagenome]
MAPKISIVMPVYNSYFEMMRSVVNIQEQTFRDWELLIVDDGSTDLKIRESMMRWMRDDERLKYVELDGNSGSPVIPRNAGVMLAKGEYVAFCDSDDIWGGFKLEKQLEYMEKHHAKFCYHDMNVVSPTEKTMWSLMSHCHEGNVFESLIRKNFIPTSSVMMQRELYGNFGGMNVKFKVSHDWD